jgi:hypothetical protein
MHALAWIALPLIFLSTALLVTGGWSEEGMIRGRVRWVGLAVFVLTFALIGTLGFAQRSLCDLLGGQWIGENQACQNEWGGNGNNDPSNGGFLFGDPTG